MAQHLGCQVVFPSGRGVEGSVTFVRSHARTISSYQLARRPERGPRDATAKLLKQRVLRELMLDMVLRIQAHMRDAEWWVGTVHDTVRFSAVCLDVAKRYLDSGRADTSSFVAYEGSTEIDSPPPPAGLSLGEASPPEEALFLRAVRSLRTAAFCDALDFHPDRFSTVELSRAWQAAGMMRDRELWIARDADGPVAAAVIDCIEDGAHLFSLLDTVRLFPLRGNTLASAAATALLHQARERYRAHGKLRFVYYLETADSAHAEAAGLVALDRADFVLLRTDLLPEFVEEVYQITASHEDARRG